MNADTFFKILTQIEGPVDYLNLILAYPEYLKEEEWKWQQTGYQKFGWTELDFRKIYQQYRQRERDANILLFVEKNANLLGQVNFWVRLKDLPKRALSLLRQMVPIANEETCICFAQGRDGYLIGVHPYVYQGSFTMEEIFLHSFHHNIWPAPSSLAYVGGLRPPTTQIVARRF